MKHLYIASKNEHKLKELRFLLNLPEIKLHLVSELSPNVEWQETGQTFIENARIKAQAVRKIAPVAVLADDSGLVVPVLGNQPGVYSSRFAGASASDLQNNEKLISLLKDMNRNSTPAFFVCAIVFIDIDGKEFSFEGRCEGEIISTPRGSFGFGYDPLFYLPHLNKTMAELAPEEKAKTSHRFVAIKQFSNHLQTML